MTAIALYSGIGIVLLAVCGTASIASVAPRSVMRALAIVSGLASVALAGWTVLSIIKSGGAQTGYQLPLAVFSLGGAVFGAIVWQAISNFVSRGADEHQADISPEVRERVADLRDSRIPEV